MITADDYFQDSRFNVFSDFNFKLEQYLLQAGRFIKAFLGLVGLYLFMFLGLITLFTPLLYLLLRWQRKSMQGEIQGMIDNIPDTAPRDLVKMHLMVERLSHKSQASIDKDALAKFPGLIRFLMREFFRYHETIDYLEDVLYRAAYPDINEQPDVTNLHYLREQIEDHEEDLLDPSLDEYEQYYLKK
ncbi:MAG: hypothetical protein RI565_09725 [Schleiferiaceae bacterium]|nr:hypothetical protein [Schleiferiaceae bacterium]